MGRKTFWKWTATLLVAGAALIVWTVAVVTSGIENDRDSMTAAENRSVDVGAAFVFLIWSGASLVWWANVVRPRLRSMKRPRNADEKPWLRRGL